jgi:two-component sensor histidine kinase
MRRLTRPVIAVLLFLGFLSAFAVPAFLFIEDHQKDYRLRIAETARAQAQGLYSYLGPFLVSAYAFGFSADSWRTASFEAHAKRLVERWPVLSHLTIAPGGVVSAVYPAYEGRSPVGIDIFADSDRKEDAIKARDTKTLVLSRPYLLANGYLGIAARYPVYVIGEDGRDRFWGLSVAVLRIDKLVELSGLPGLERRGYRWALSLAGEDGSPFAASAAGPPGPGEAVRQLVELPDHSWSLTLGPERPRPYGLIRAVAAALCAAAAAMVAYLASRWIARSRELAELTSRLSASVAEKETLLREIHHRVKNNLMVVESVVALQSIDAQGTRFEEAFAQLAKRIHSISLIHDKLYRGKDLDSVDAAPYVRDLVEYIADTLGDSEQGMEVEADEFPLPAKSAMPVGLILTELCTNAFKYGANAPVRVRLRREADQVRLEVEDDGPPPPENFRESGGLGLRLVEALVSQIFGSWRVESGPPVRFVVEFPLDPTEPRPLPADASR